MAISKNSKSTSRKNKKTRFQKILDVFNPKTKKGGMLLFGLVFVAFGGGYYLYNSFAASYLVCNQQGSIYLYDEKCITESNEATIVRLFYGILGRAPDRSGLNYWVDQLSNKSVSVPAIAGKFMTSSEFKNKYGSLSNEAFVKAMYPQVFGRQPDAAGLKYWTGQLDVGKYTRPQLMAFFTQSNEMKTRFSTKVAAALGIYPTTYSQKLTTFGDVSTKCYGTVVTDTTGKWCTIAANATATVMLSATVPSDIVKTDGAYVLCYNESRSGVIQTSPAYYRVQAELVRNSLADNVLYLSSDMMGAWSSTSGNGSNCNIFITAKEDLGSFIMTAFGSGQSASGTHKIDMNSLYLGKLNNQGTTILSKLPSAVKLETTSSQITMGPGVTKNKNYVYYSINSDSTKPQPYLTHQTGYFIGKKSVTNLMCENLDYMSPILKVPSAKATLTPTVINADNGKAMSGYEFVTTEYDVNNNAYQRKFYPGQAINLSTDSSKYYTNGYMVLRMDNTSTTPVRAKIDMTITNGSCRAVNTPWEYNLWFN